MSHLGVQLLESQFRIHFCLWKCIFRRFYSFFKNVFILIIDDLLPCKSCIFASVIYIYILYSKYSIDNMLMLMIHLVIELINHLSLQFEYKFECHHFNRFNGNQLWLSNVFIKNRFFFCANFKLPPKNIILTLTILINYYHH